MGRIVSRNHAENQFVRHRRMGRMTDPSSRYVCEPLLEHKRHIPLAGENGPHYRKQVRCSIEPVKDGRCSGREDGICDIRTARSGCCHDRTRWSDAITRWIVLRLPVSSSSSNTTSGLSRSTAGKGVSLSVPSLTVSYASPARSRQSSRISE